MDHVSADAWAQVIALLLTTLISGGAAYFGARFGADATRQATKDAIAAQQQSEAEGAAQVRRTLLLAFIVELRLNAKTLHLGTADLSPGEKAAMRNTFLERQAADAVVPVLHELPDTLRQASIDLRAHTIRSNTAIELAQSFRGDVPVSPELRSAVYGQIDAMRNEAPNYQSLANDIESLVKADSLFHSHA